MSATMKPGRFEATCKLKHPVLFNDLDEETRALVDADVTTPGRLRSYWDRKLEAIVVDVRCDFETESRDEFEQHMLLVHGRKSKRRAVWSTPGSELPYRTAPGWKPPKLKDEGTPWIDKEGRTKACRGCGFVVELGADSTAIIEEHKATCAERDDAAEVGAA